MDSIIFEGLAGFVVPKNDCMSNIISEIQSMIIRLDKRAESLNGDPNSTVAFEAQVRCMAHESPILRKFQQMIEHGWN